MSANANLVSLIQQEIQRQGPIPFARFMELALYAPDLGYYERQRAIGRRGDFYTSVSAGPLFGEMLAFQFAHWLGHDNSFDKLQIAEAGAHDGSLMADILRWMQSHRPDLHARLEYCLVETSATRRDWQKQTLAEHLSKIKWAGDIAEAGGEKTTRIIFCNELLDAMPVHRCIWNAAAKAWDENVVAVENGNFVWQRATPAPELAAALPQIAPELAAVLPDGYIVEHSPAAVEWWKKAAATLGHGILLTIDYGLIESELLRPERSGGTLRTYIDHHPGGSLLDTPGECDITAHVNFPAIEAAGGAAGLLTEELTEQGKYLTHILARTESYHGRFDPWTPARIKQFQTLTHPDHLGRAFRVLVQSRLSTRD